MSIHTHTPAEPLDRAGTERHLHVLYRHAPATAWIEVRYRHHAGMRQTFHPATALDTVASAILARSAATDVFIGVIPRSHKRGAKADLIGHWNVTWADCDTPDAMIALGAFQPKPTLIIASSEQHRHAYWLLTHPIALERIESLNRRLAVALGADSASTDAPRILRPAGTLNHKHQPPTPVRLLHIGEQNAVAVSDLEGSLPPEPPRQRARTSAVSLRSRADVLRAVPPRVYVERLTDQQVARSGKIHCPFHEDRTPSLHVYPEPGRGWYCYGCRRGGSVYDLAALLWQRETRGQEFHRLRADLQALLSPMLDPGGPAV